MTKTHLENTKDDKRWQGNVTKKKKKNKNANTMKLWKTITGVLKRHSGRHLEGFRLNTILFYFGQKGALTDGEGIKYDVGGQWGSQKHVWDVGGTI